VVFEIRSMREVEKLSFEQSYYSWYVSGRIELKLARTY